jgi:hypothetical protein
MKLINEFKLLVLVGMWNRRIFSADWIKNYLLPQDDFTIEFSLNLDGSHRISSEKIRIEFHNDRLIFIPKNNNIATYELISDLSIKIADYFPHTPVISYGINFIFECQNSNIQNQLIKISDVDKLNEYGVNIIKSQHKHSVKFNDIFINITVSINNEKLYFDFNFHSDIKNLAQFKDKIYEFSINKLYRIALEIMKNVYMFQLDGE